MLYLITTVTKLECANSLYPEVHNKWKNTLNKRFLKYFIWLSKMFSSERFSKSTCGILITFCLGLKLVQKCPWNTNLIFPAAYIS